MSIQEIDLGKRNLLPEDLNNPVIDEPTPMAEVDLEADFPSEENRGAQVVEEKKVEYTAREKQLFERLKKAEAQLKDRPATLDKSVGKEETSSGIDPFGLAKTVASLRDYDATEIDFAATISKVKGISPQEAVQTPDFKLWLTGKRDQDYKNKSIPVPGGAGGSGQGFPTNEEIEKMTPAQHQKFEREFLARSKNKGSGL